MHMYLFMYYTCLGVPTEARVGKPLELEFWVVVNCHFVTGIKLRSPGEAESVPKPWDIFPTMTHYCLKAIPFRSSSLVHSTNICKLPVNMAGRVSDNVYTFTTHRGCIASWTKKKIYMNKCRNVCYEEDGQVTIRSKIMERWRAGKASWVLREGS